MNISSLTVTAVSATVTSNSIHFLETPVPIPSPLLAVINRTRENRNTISYFCE